MSADFSFEEFLAAKHSAYADERAFVKDAETFAHIRRIQAIDAASRRYNGISPPSDAFCPALLPT